MALSQARAAGVFTVAHEAFWTKARARHGDSDATRALIEVLLLHRHLPTAAVIAGIEGFATRNRWSQWARVRGLPVGRAGARDARRRLHKASTGAKP